MLHPCCAAAAKKKSRKKKRLSFRKGDIDDVHHILTEKSGDEKSDEILSDALLKLDDVIRNAKPEKKVRTPDGSENVKNVDEGASKNPTRSKVSRDSKNCCKHSENLRSNKKKCSAPDTVEKTSSDPKSSKKSKNQISTTTTTTATNDVEKLDDDDSLIGSHFIPDHVKSLIPERV